MAACSSKVAPHENVRTTTQPVTLTHPVGQIQAFAGSGTRGFSPSGTSVSIAQLNSPQGVAIAPDGKVYIADTGNNRIVRVDGTAITTVVGGQTAAVGVGYGNLLANPGAETAQSTSGTVPGWQNFDVNSTWDAITRDPPNPTRPEPLDGDFYLRAGATATARAVQKIDVTMYPGVANGTQWFSFSGFVSSLDQGAGTTDQAEILIQYRGVGSHLLDFYDSTLIASRGVWTWVHDTRAAPAGTQTIWVNLISTRLNGAGDDAYYDGLSLRALPAGNTLGDNGNPINATLDHPRGITFGSDGSLYIADSYNHRIRRVVLNGTPTITSIGNGTPGDLNGAAGTAEFDCPVDVSAPAGGTSVYVADLLNNQLRLISSANSSPQVSILSSALAYPSGVSNDGPNTWTSDRGNFRIVSNTGGNLGSGRGFTDALDPVQSPFGLYGRAQGIASSTGSVSHTAFVADLSNHAVRHIDDRQAVQTVVGQSGTPGTSGDNGPGYAALLREPVGLAYGSLTNQLFIADAEDNRVRVLNCASWDRCSGTDLTVSGGICSQVPNSISVNDGNACTIDQCWWTNAGVTHQPTPNGSSCSDGNPQRSPQKSVES
jgi:hypothetical protein